MCVAGGGGFGQCTGEEVDGKATPAGAVLTTAVQQWASSLLVECKLCDTGIFIL